MTAKYLLYFCISIDSVFDSQVLELILNLSKKKIFKKVYLFAGVKNDEQRHEFREKKFPRDIEAICYRSYPNYPFFNRLLRKQISKALKRNDLVFEESIFHIRNELLCWHLSKILGEKYFRNFLPDIRGVSLEQTTEFEDLNRLLKYLKIWNKKRAIKVLKVINKISVVSESLGKYLTDGYKINSNNLVITPCLAGKNFKLDSTQRILIRRELNIGEDVNLIVFSSGGTANWQNNDILKILAHKEMKILNLSKKEIQHRNVINKFINYSQMPLYLNAADIAIIWREKSVVNAVASPVKFSEYICCGLPIITNDSVDFITNYIKTSSYGVILKKLDEVNEDKINRLISMNRQKIADMGNKLLGIDSISEKYVKIYSSLL
jgi:hypothetical protein